MPRYFLHVEDGTHRIEDPEGSELPDLAAAREEALTASRQLWANALRDQVDLGQRRFVIMDESGTLLASVDMDEALPERLRRRSHDIE